MVKLHKIGMIRTLQIGFGGLLLLILVSAAAQLLVIQTAREFDRQARAANFARGRVLDELRDAAFLSGTFARDYLLTPDPKSAAPLRREVDGNRRRAEAALATYPYGSADATTKVLLDDLRGELNVYWKVLELLLDVAARGRVGPGTDRYFTQSLTNRRETITGIMSRIREIGEAENRRREEEIASNDRVFLLTLAAIAAATILLGWALAAAASRHLVHLQQQAAARLAETVKARESLAELSDKLVRAQEDERRSISRELHDEVGQSLSALIVEAGNTAATLPDGQAAEARERLESMRSIAQRCLAAVRNMSLLLRPSMLDDFGLVPALEWQAREVQKRSGLRVTVRADDEAGELPDDHRTCIFRLAQETLHNITKHAQAKNAHLTLVREAESVRLTVEDDGHGFDSERTRGLGLLGMSERVARLRGSFDIDSSPGNGTRVTVMLPLTTPVSAAREGAL
jgi:signal transduction histidine kinase